MKGKSSWLNLSGAKVFGVLGDERSNTKPGLLALEDNLQTVTLNGRNWRTEIFALTHQLSTSLYVNERPTSPTQRSMVKS